MSEVIFLIDVIFFKIQHLLRTSLHIYYPDIRELFWDVKKENGVFGKEKLDTHQAKTRHR